MSHKFILMGFSFPNNNHLEDSELTMPQWKYVDPNKLRVGDVIGVTSIISFPAWIIKRTTNGLEHSLDPYVSSHIGVICDRGGGLLYCCEMVWPKIRMRSLQEYNNNMWWDHVVFAGRHPALDDPNLRDKANDFLITSHAKRIKYSLEELLEFWGVPCEAVHPANKLTCGELPRQMFKALGLSYPLEWDKKVSPWDWQDWKDLPHTAFV